MGVVRIELRIQVMSGDSIAKMLLTTVESIIPLRMGHAVQYRLMLQSTRVLDPLVLKTLVL